MADDKLDLVVEISAHTQGLDGVARQASLAQDAIESLSRAGGIGEEVLKSYSSAGEKVAATLGGMGRSASRQLSSFESLQKGVRETTKELQNLAQAHVVRGGRSPLGVAAKDLSLQQAKQILAVQEASNLTAEQAAAKRVAMAVREESAQKSLLQGQKALNAAKQEETRAGMTALEAAKDRLRVAKEELHVANSRAGGLSRGSGVENTEARAKNLQEQARARLQVLEATRAVTREEEKAEKATRSSAASLPTLRYAMYDVARTAGIMSAAIAATGTAMLAASASYESSFTTVERTSGAAGEQARRLRDDLLGLSRQIPQSFGEISNIAARGAQLGVATSQLGEFTNTVAQFVATSDTVSLDQAVEAFGRISNLLGDTDFNRIGSAITLVGVNSAATEAQIVKTTQELAPFATAVGMTADQTIGLAAALASLGQPPERARSAFLTLQRVMDNAIASGSDNLQSFASLLNVSVDEVEKLWKQDPSQFISSFAAALGSVDDLTTTFADLGINERRAVQVFQALAADSRNAAGGVSVLTQALSDSSQGYEEGSELARQYGLIVDDLASKWQLLLNAIREFAASTGDALAPLAKTVLDVATALIRLFTDVTRTPFGGFAVKTVAVVGGLLFVLTSTVASVALFTASLAAGKTALVNLNAAAGGSIFTINGLKTAMAEFSLATGVSTGALRVFRTALAATGIGLAVLALGTLVSAFMEAGESADSAFDRIVGGTSGLAEALAADTQNYLDGVAGSYQKINPYIEENTAATDDNRRAIQNTATVLGLVPPSMDAANAAIDANTQYLGENTVAWLKNQLMQSEAFRNLAGNQEFTDYWVAIGANMEEVIRLSAGGGEQAVLDYFQRLENAAIEGGARFSRAFASGTKGFQTSGPGAALQSGWGIFGTSTGRGLNDITKALSGFNGQMALMGTQSRKAGVALTEADDSGDDFNNTLRNIGGGGGSAAQAAKEVRTLVDYSNDLSKVWSRAFDIRFSGQQTLDTITSSFISIREAADEAAKRIRDLNNDIASLSSDIDIQEYFLSIAVEYGDTKRAAAIEADLAKKRADLADKSEELQKEQNKANKTLVGNSKAAIDNRKQITDLVQQYQAHIQALASSGMSQARLAEATKRLKADFLAQATQLGYNRKELQIYAKAFDDVAVAISKVPRNITVKANTNPAIQAFREYEAALNKVRANVSKGGFTPGFNSNNLKKAARAQALYAEIAVLQYQLDKAKSERAATSLADAIQSLKNKLQSGNYWTGGFTGPGGKYEPAGIVHRGEYVIPKKDVNQATGLPYADALGRLMSGIPGMASGGTTVGSGDTLGSAMVALTPGTIQAIAQATGKVIVLDGQVIAESSEKQYAHQTTVGAY